MKGKKILIGITGSIAAYKTVWLVRLLVKAGAEVKVLMTPSAREFVSPLALSTLSKNAVPSSLVDGDEWNNHVALGRWADLMLIVPLSCNTLAKMAAGQCGNLLLAVYLSAKCPVAVAPAMDEDMWQHPATQRNLRALKYFGVRVLDPEEGELASGLHGVGRVAEPETVFGFLRENFFRGDRLKGKKALVTAGPTYEPIDPVRFIGNYSSGKMGFALANALYENGADVALITGPTNQQTEYKGIAVIPVTSGDQMFEACKQQSADADIIVMNAAVADFKPKAVANKKIKKSGGLETLSLEPTTDILRWFGSNKRPGQCIVGFALETDNEKANALAKLKDKNIDCIILNSLQNDGAGFGHGTNEVTIFDSSREIKLPLEDKKQIAEKIVDYIVSAV